MAMATDTFSFGICCYLEHLRRRHYSVGELFPQQQQYVQNLFSEAMRLVLEALWEPVVHGRLPCCSIVRTGPAIGSSLSSLQMLNTLGIISRLGTGLVWWASVRGTLPPQLVWITTGMAALLGQRNPFCTMILTLILLRLVGEWLVANTTTNSVGSQ
jgi:hypothetical protein